MQERTSIPKFPKHFDGKRFYNPDAPQAPGYLEAIRWKLTSWPEPSPRFISDVEQSSPPRRLEGSGLRITLVNHSTVLRRIAQLEERLGVHMFKKLPSGYRLTAAGEEVLEFADQMEASSHLLETRVFGRDQSVRGLLRVTLAPPLATHLLMPDFADFARLHPDIEMEILSSGELANLTNREADVAIRVVYDRKTLPLNLHGMKGPELFGGVYMSCDRLAAWRAGAPDPIRWIVISIHGIPDWASEGEVRTTGVPFRTTDAEAQIVAVRQGLGMTTLPCFVGDADPLLVRVPGTELHMYGTVWLLTQGETRKTKRVRLFTEFVSRRLAAYAPLLAGLSTSRD